MCTVTWLHDATGFYLFHNRDELHTRRPALGPRVHERDSVRFIAPVDADAGGTWIGVNEFGLAACLLNRYDARHAAQPAAPKTGFTSRGLLLLSLLACPSHQAAQAHLIDLPLDHYQPFELVLAQFAPSSNDASQAHTKITVMDWTGRTLHVDARPDRRLPLVSSSLDGEKASAVRHQLYTPLRGHETADTLRRFHAGHAGHADDASVTPTSGSNLGSAFSVCMHRADAQTVSFTEIQLAAAHVSLRYIAASPCLAEQANTTQMSLPRTSVGPMPEPHVAVEK